MAGIILRFCSVPGPATVSDGWAGSSGSPSYSRVVLQIYQPQAGAVKMNILNTAAANIYFRIWDNQPICKLTSPSQTRSPQLENNCTWSGTRRCWNSLLYRSWGDNGKGLKQIFIQIPGFSGLRDIRHEIFLWETHHVWIYRLLTSRSRENVKIFVKILLTKKIRWIYVKVFTSIYYGIYVISKLTRWTQKGLTWLLLGRLRMCRCREWGPGWGGRGRAPGRWTRRTAGSAVVRWAAPTCRVAPGPACGTRTAAPRPGPAPSLTHLVVNPPASPRHATVRHNYVSIARIWKYLAAWSESIKMHYRYSAYYNALLTRNWQQTSTETNCNTSLNLHDGR